MVEFARIVVERRVPNVGSIRRVKVENLEIVVFKQRLLVSFKSLDLKVG